MLAKGGPGVIVMRKSTGSPFPGYKIKIQGLTVLTHKGPKFLDDIFKRMFLNESVCIFIRNLLECVLEYPIVNNTALV